MDRPKEIRIVITTRDSLRHKIFLTEACESFGINICGIFIQNRPSTGNIHKSSIKHNLKKLIPPFLKNFIKKLFKTPEYVNIDSLLLRNFKDIDTEYWQNINAPIHYTDDINSIQTIELLRECRPDLIMVFGGSILENNWITLPRLGSINLHTGMLPFYRSCNSTEFAMYQEKLDKIGFSIHYIDEGIDTGPIIIRQKIEPYGKNSFAKLKAEIITKGIEAFIDIAREIINSNKKLDVIKENCTDSYYPHAVYHNFIGQVARYRLRLLNKYSWPLTPCEPQGFNLLRDAFKKQNMHNGVYILNYHNIVNSKNPDYWETISTRTNTSVSNFKEHLEFLSNFAEAIKLSDVPGLLKYGPANKPYFVITFDDAYINLPVNAEQLCDKYGITPTLFICGDYANQQIVNFRILLAILLQENYQDKLINSFNQTFNLNLNRQSNLIEITKYNYFYKKTEQAIIDVWKENKGDLPNVHLDLDAIRKLAEKWEIGNHTLSHPILAKLSYEEQKYEIEKNIQIMEDAEIPYIKWLSYPYGAAKNVNQLTHLWMQNNPDWFGIFAKGGVNTFYTRTEWLRIGIAECSLTQLQQKLK